MPELNAGEPTNWELDRRFGRLETSLESGFRRMDERLDKMVTTDVFAINQQSTEARLTALAAEDKALEQKVDRIEERRATDRRLMIPIAGSAVIAAVGWVVSAIGNAPPLP